MQKDSKIYVAGHRGMVGSALVRRLQKDGYTNILVRTSSELDLTSQQGVADFFAKEKPDYVFLAAARVGGIHANDTYRADFIYQNLMIECNVIHQSYVNGVKKLLFLGSSCIYPKNAPQPIKEEHLLTSVLEPTNEPYAIAKIAGLKLCENYNRQYGCDFISAMPTNLYGPNDNYDLNNSHVLPAILRKFYEAKEKNAPTVEIWGTGKPRREFLHVDDLADACMFLMDNYSGLQIVNVGFGSDVSIGELAELVKNISGYQGKLVYNTEKPDGTMRKLMDSSFLRSMGWSPKITLEDGIKTVYRNVFIDKTETITLR
ncbi:MAG: GDP-L-fucose synthase family protein [Flavobacteriales bacterium]